MKKQLYWIGILLIAMTFSACNNQKEAKKEMKNPLTEKFTAKYGIPDFEAIKPEHFMPALEQGIEEHNKEIAAIINNKAKPDFDNTIAAMSRSGRLLHNVSSIFDNQTSANTNDALNDIAGKISEKLSQHEDAVRFNPRLVKRIKAVYDNRNNLGLTEEQMYLLENQYQSLVQNGAMLSDDKKEELKKINTRLSALSLKFEQNVLKETNQFELVVDNKKDLAGLPESSIQAAAETAKEKGYKNKWVFTIHKPSMIPFLQYAKNRDLREKLYMAYTHAGNNDNEFDNKKILKELLDLRLKKANLLGFKTHADYRLASRMAKRAGDVNEKLMQVWRAALPVAKKERDEMQQLIKKEKGKFKLDSWDWWYYAEKIRKQKYDLDDSELRPYFELKNVRDGAFMCAKELYGFNFSRINDVPLPHPDAEAYKVTDEKNEMRGILFMDFHPRASKRGGAWCSDYRGHEVNEKGEEIKPLVTVVCNFTKPTADKPALLSLDEVETLFHEFGHAIDALSAKNSYPLTFVARDFVEFPSQFMEHWATHPEVLKLYANHYKTGENIPKSLIKKIENSGYFNQGFSNIEFLAAAILDMQFHTITSPLTKDVMTFENEKMKEIGLIAEILPRYRSTYFRHISGGYDAGYYSYLWSAILDNDAFEMFKETNIFNKEVAARYKNNVLSYNGIKDPEKLYVDFRGQKPTIDALLKNRGLK